MAQNATININAVDNTRAAFLGVQRNLQGVGKQLQINQSGMAMLARRYLSLAAVAMGATRTIREVMTATESIKGLDPSVAASVALLRRDFEGLLGTMDGFAQRMTASVIGGLGNAGRAIGRFIVNPFDAAARAADLANDRADGLRITLERIVGAPQVQRSIAEVDAAMKATAKNLVELQRMGVEMNSIMVDAGPPLTLRQNIEAMRELDRQLQAVNTLVEELRTRPLSGDEEAPKRMEELNAAMREQVELYQQIAKVSGNVIALEKERTRAAREAAKILSEGFEDAVFSGKKLSDVVKQLTMDLVRMAFRSAITAPLGNALGGFFGGLSLFGGARAMGGPVSSGKSYLVGERGPEIFTPTSAGNVISNEKSTSGGQGGSTYYIDARGADQTGLARLEGLIRQTQASIKPIALGARHGCPHERRRARVTGRHDHGHFLSYRTPYRPGFRRVTMRRAATWQFTPRPSPGSSRFISTPANS
jgi:ethanolamine utilization microcompartment shell protein EutS